MSTDANSARWPTWLIVGLACVVGIPCIAFSLAVVACLSGNMKEGREAGHPCWTSAEARGRKRFITSLKATPDTLRLPEGTIRIKECWLEHEVDFEVGLWGWYSSRKTGRVICCITLAEGESLLTNYPAQFVLLLHSSDPPSFFGSISTGDEAVFHLKSRDAFDNPIAVRVAPKKKKLMGTIILLSRADEKGE